MVETTCHGNNDVAGVQYDPHFEAKGVVALQSPRYFATTRLEAAPAIFIQHHCAITGDILAGDGFKPDL